MAITVAPPSACARISSGRFDCYRLHRLSGMAGDALYPIAIVDLRLEDLDILPRDYGSPHAPNQLFGFAAEHAAADHFNAPGVVFHFGLALVRSRGLQFAYQTEQPIASARLS